MGRDPINFFSVMYGVRQGSVLALFLFAIYLDDLSEICTPNCGRFIILHADDIFGKVGSLASDKVTLQLIKSKCIPVLFYGLVACPLNKTQSLSLDFTINRFLMKLFSF